MKHISPCRALAPILFLLVSGIAAAADEMVYRARPGDTLIGIGERLLARPADWPKLVRPNRVADPNRIRPGREIRIPLELLRSSAASATVVHASGDVRAGTSKIGKGAELPEGAALATGKDGYATLRLADGSLLNIQRESEMKLERMRTYPGTEFVRSEVRLDAGRVEANARARAPGASRFEVRTPLATAAVRGTDFRVSAGADGKSTAAEVLTGTVALGGGAQAEANTVMLAAGFGSVVDERRVPRPAAPLLAAPNLSGLEFLQERVVVRMRFADMTGASAYRIQVADDAEFRSVVREDVVRTPDVRITGLADGGYHFRARAIDSSGLEGRDANAAFRLKARPEPPFASSPAPRGKVRADEVALEWTANPDAAAYRLQIAHDEKFANPLRNESGLRDTRYTLSGVKFGAYFWRIASIKGTDDHGPWGDPQSFSFLPPPANPEPPSETADSFVFRWPGEPGQRFLLQIAQDESFARLTASLETGEPAASIARPQPGIYFLRVRATDPDGFVGPFTRAQRFEVKRIDPPPPMLRDGAGGAVTTSDGRPLLLK